MSDQAWEMTPEKQDERFQDLLDLAESLHEDLLAAHTELGEKPEEIKLDKNRIRQIVDDYVDHLRDFKKFHEFPGDRLAENDKIAGLTSVLIMRRRPFYTETGEVNSPISAGANEWFAIAWSNAVLGITVQQPVHFDWFYHCFSQAIDDDATMHTWVVLSKKLYRFHGPGRGDHEVMTDTDGPEPKK